MEKKMIVLETTNLIKHYETKGIITKAVDGVSLSIEQGEFIAIVGESGSGKTTLLHLLGGLDKPTSGTISIEDVNINDMGEDELTIFRRERIGFVFQSYNLLQSLNVHDNIVLPLVLDKKKVSNEYLSGIVNTLGIEDKLHNSPNQLSGGEQQRVAIARAMINKPAIILADEPTGNLDSKNSDSVMNLIRELKDQYNQTVVMITHDLGHVQLADRSYELIDGKIVE